MQADRACSSTPKKRKYFVIDHQCLKLKPFFATGAVGYILNVRIEGDDGLIESRNTTNMRYTINNLKGGESYFATLIAFSYDLAESMESDVTLMETSELF